MSPSLVISLLLELSKEGWTWELIQASTLYFKSWLKTRPCKVPEKTTTYVHEVNHKCSISIFRMGDLEKVHAAQAWTPEEAIQQVRHPRESVWDTVQKLTCPLLDPTVQLGLMIYSGSNHKPLQCSSHDRGGHGGSWWGRAGGGWE